MSEWAGRHADGWNRVVEALRRDGWTVEMTSVAGPVQLEGRLPGGETFYFRSRHEHVSLGVGGDDPAWEREERHPGASFLPADQGLEIILRLARSYAEAIAGQRPPPAT